MTDAPEAEAYVSPLRRAVIELLTYDSGWTPEQAAAIGGTDVRAARSFCTRLLNTEVLAKTGAGKYLRGPRAQEWIDTPTRTHQGGRSRRYQAAKALRDSKATRDWHKDMGHDVTTEEGAVHSDHVPLVELTEAEENLTVNQVAKWLNVHRNTVLSWIKGAKIRAVRLPNGKYRIARQAVRDIMEPTDGQS